jgi:GntR family negative regulator for fad regulon and positive regulator of fabA
LLSIQRVNYSSFSHLDSFYGKLYNLTGQTTYQLGAKLMNWDSIPKPAEIAETRLLEAILDGTFPIDSTLPGERDLAAQIGVTRPTLREALQRLARDSWLDIQQGKPTRVRDYWHEGSLAVLAALAQSPQHQSPDFVSYLLEIRLLLAPAYTRQALAQSCSRISELLKQADQLNEDPAAFAQFDWQLHFLLTQLAPNPVFRLLLNSFESLYALMAERYFSFEACRQNSRAFYAALLTCADNCDLNAAETITHETMQASLDLWQRLQGGDEE